MTDDRHGIDLAAEAIVAADEHRSIREVLIEKQRNGTTIDPTLATEVVREFYGDAPPAHAFDAVLDAIAELELISPADDSE